MELKLIEKFHGERNWALKKHYREFWYKLLEKTDNNGEYLVTKGIVEGEMKDLFNQYMDKKTEWKKKKYKYMMFTINPTEDCLLIWLLNKINKGVKKKWIKNYIWCIEWRDEFKGMHAHIRVEVLHGKRAKECNKEMYNTFKECLGNPMHCNWKGSDREDAFVDYVKGIKEGKPKENGAHDKMNRAELNLENFYISDI